MMQDEQPPRPNKNSRWCTCKARCGGGQWRHRNTWVEHAIFRYQEAEMEIEDEEIEEDMEEDQEDITMENLYSTDEILAIPSQAPSQHQEISELNVS
ncbi:hypothetical protein BT69DRAFT_1276945, partial [Atractiella rhizophila]